MSKKTLVIGASANPERYSNMAVNRLLAKGHEVEALGKRPGEVQGVSIATTPMPLENIDTVTLYLNPRNQQQYYDYIVSLNPKRVIFNPGAENDELEDILKEKGIKVQEACTLVLLSTGQF